MNKIIYLIITLVCSGSILFSQTATIQIDAQAGQKPISPCIYGKNNSLSDDPGNPLKASQWQLMKDAGLKMLRENGGNNATKYNWRLKLSSHPDWYNNVYAHNWDYAAQSLQNNMPGIPGMWAFQLIGQVASNTSNNFNDYLYNKSAWWSGVAQNLAGGGVVNATGGAKATKEGDPNLYLTNWPADSTVDILNHWFGTGGLGLNKEVFRYWNMDNEPEIWSGTHDDIMPTQLSAEDFMQRYFIVAKKARALYPDIKLVGPVTCNEWQWFAWGTGNSISYGGKNYCWLEYFIKRIAEEQITSGIKLLDVFDLHFYPGESDTSNVVQLHRVFFDKTYSYPGANGIKTINGGWDNSMTKEYIFERCRAWLETYMGANHGITFSVSEMDVNNNAPGVVAVWHASMLGTFADNGVEFFTPWSWKTGMWESLHLFSKYAKTTRVQSTSDHETDVSAYSSLNLNQDSLTVILVNRSKKQTYSTSVNVSNFTISNGNYNTLTLSNLPNNETFVSHTKNALVSGTVTVSNKTFSISLPPLSIKAVLLAQSSPITNIEKVAEKTLLDVLYDRSGKISISYTVSNDSFVQIDVFNMEGQKIRTIVNKNQPMGHYAKEFDGSGLAKGIYLVRYSSGTNSMTGKLKLD